MEIVHKQVYITDDWFLCQVVNWCCCWKWKWFHYSNLLLMN